MKKYSLNDMTKGWLIGNFSPSIHLTNEFEVAVKSYRKGDSEQKHYHKIATEITVIVIGKVSMNGTVYGKSDIVVIEPYETVDFVALEDTETTVVKIPCVKDDKFLWGE